MTQCATYRPAGIGEVTVGTLVYITYGPAYAPGYAKGKVSAIIPDIGIQVRIDPCENVESRCYPFAELYLKVD